MVKKIRRLAKKTHTNKRLSSLAYDQKSIYLPILYSSFFFFKKTVLHPKPLHYTALISYYVLFAYSSSGESNRQAIHIRQLNKYPKLRLSIHNRRPKPSNQAPPLLPSPARQSHSPLGRATQTVVGSSNRGIIGAKQQPASRVCDNGGFWQPSKYGERMSGSGDSAVFGFFSQEWGSDKSVAQGVSPCAASLGWSWLLYVVL